MSGVRVVVTGLGCVTPYGVGVQALWQGLCSGVSAVTAHKLELPSNLPVKVAATIPDDKSINANAFVPQDHFTATELRRTHKFVQLAIVAATEALTDAGLTSLTPEQLTETGVSVGSGVGSLEDIMENAKYVESNDIRKISPFFVPRMLINMPAGEISIRFRLQVECACVLEHKHMCIYMCMCCVSLCTALQCAHMCVFVLSCTLYTVYLIRRLELCCAVP
eukprot:c9138_g1_i3.p1 GENE.c9138_g1_i3~~c9138_g1_i3.p1  ORF type:complete len:221 (-),score=42.33 c9138_g1_i3:562-1224(-)